MANLKISICYRNPMTDCQQVTIIINMQVILITIFAALFTQLGYFFWKIAANNLSDAKFVLKDYLKNWQWLLGFLFTVVGWILFVKATDVGEISLVEPLMSIGELFLIILAFIFFKERMSHKEWIGILFSLIGVCLLSSEAKVNMTSKVNWTNLYAFTLVSTVASVIIYIKSKKVIHQEVYLGIVCGISFGIAAIFTELMTAYIARSGDSFFSVHFFLNPIFPFMMIANIVSLFLIQVALQSGRVSVVIPVELSIVSGMSVIGGAYVFSEVITPIRLSGIALILFGTYLMHKKEELFNS